MSEKHISYHVCVDNYHAQISRMDSDITHVTRDEAVEEIISRNHDAIDEDIMIAVDKVADIDEDHDTWDREYNRLWSEMRAEIAESGYEDGNGHRYYVREEDDRAPFYVARIRSFYAYPDVLSIMEDEHGCELEFYTIDEARSYIDELESSRYYLTHNESGRPDYIIIDQATRDWLNDEDQGKFDWDGCSCKRRDEDLEEMCDGYSVLDDERYGTVAIVYKDEYVPTQGQFAKDCGYDPDDVDNPDEYVPTVTLHDYVLSIGDGYKNSLVDLPDDVAKKIDDWFDRSENCCGECDTCVALMRSQEIAYIRNHAITEED